MIAPCISCGHRVWSVPRDMDGRLVQVHFDGEETSETYAAPVTLCPGCGRSLAGPTLEGTRDPRYLR